MLVIADSSPLIVLVKVGHVEILPQLFGQIVIPPAVAAELRRESREPIILAYYDPHPAWLDVKAPAQVAISLAVELGADVLLIDERKAYREAAARNLPAIGTIRVLERGAEAGLLDLADAFERVKQTDFWISHTLLDERLRLYRERGNS
jgi:predicted nucleic acid-binding protein